MKIQKRNGLYQEYDKNKIKLAIQKAFNSLDQIIGKTDLDKIIEEVEKDLADQINVEMIQDKVEEALMKQGYLQVAKAYILYRQKHSEQRDIINELIALIKNQDGVLGIDDFKTRMFGNKIYVDIEIRVSGDDTFQHAHLIAHKTHDVIEDVYPIVKHCNIHVNPGKIGS